MFEEISTKEVIETYIDSNPDSTVSKLIKVIGIGSVIAILEDNNFKNKLLYLPRLTSLWRTAKPVIVQKKLKGLVGEEREEMVEQLSKFFNVSKRVIEKMNETGKYHRN